MSAVENQTVHVVVDEPDMFEYRKLLAQQAPELKVTLCEEPALPPPEIAEAEILLTWRPHPQVLQGMPKLKWIHSTGAGVEGILRCQHFSPTVTLTRTGQMAGRLMAEYVIGFILAHSFQLPLIAENQKQHRWQLFKVLPIQHRRCMILGMGEIGREIAQLCQAIGLQVTGVSRNGGEMVDGIPDYPIAELDTLLPQIDILVVVVPLTSETEGMIDSYRLRLLPQHALLMNISRGPVVVEADLIAALQDGSLGAAVLDVFDREPLPADSVLWDMPNVMITPHIAGPYDPEFCTRSFLENLDRYLAGKKLNHRVDASKEY
jgi:phosphoglycerate dehydrogenase-like enzyme